MLAEFGENLMDYQPSVRAVVMYATAVGKYNIVYV